MPSEQHSQWRKAGSWLAALISSGAIVITVGAAGLSQNHAALLTLLNSVETKDCPDWIGFSSASTQGKTTTTQNPEQSKVTALGHLEPVGEVTRLAPPAIAKAERIQSILVKAGQKVRKGEAIAVMDSKERLSAALVEADKRVSVSQTQLNRVLAGSKKGEIIAQIATMNRLEEELAGRRCAMDSIGERLTAECRLAQRDFDRYQSLFSQGAVCAADVDIRRTKLETTRASLSEAVAERRRMEETTTSALAEARATLQKIQEIRPVDIEVARAELESMKAAAEKARIDLNMATIRAPMDGQILKVWAHEGEPASDKGIVELGISNSMCAVTEVFESDLKFVRTGQSAKVRGEAFSGVLHGRITEIARRVTKQNTFADEPGANFDNRVVEVKVLLSPESSRRVEGLTNLQVEVEIIPGGEGAAERANQEKNGADGKEKIVSFRSRKSPIKGGA